jgi:hypothetical protein
MATMMAMVMARAYKNPSFMNLPFFGDVVEIASFLHISDELATGWYCQDGNGICLPLICLQIICVFEIWMCQSAQTGLCWPVCLN